MMPSTSAALLMVSPSSSTDLPIGIGPPKPAACSRSRTPAPRPSESEDDVNTNGVKFRKEFFTCKEDIDPAGDGELTLERGSIIELVSKQTTHGGLWRGKCKGKEGLFKKDAVIKIGEVPEQIAPSAIDLVEEIGSGGFAVVYKAQLRRKNGLLETVAYKKPHYTAADISKVKKEVEHEASFFNILRHDNIVRLEGICLEEPIGVLLELCHGGRLKEVYAKLPDISTQIIIDWASQIAEGMHYIHHGLAIEYYHRDLTTSNVLVKELVCTCNVANTKRLSDEHKNIRGGGVCRNCPGTACSRLTLKISDFGMARSERDDRKSAFGTVAYQAPEVMKREFSNTCDTYSFGVVFWELFTKCVPFQDRDDGVIIYQVGKLHLKPPIPENCPSDIKQLLNDCWETNPEDRPNFKEIRSSLSELKDKYSAVDEILEAFRKNMRHEIQQKMSRYAKLSKWKDHELLIRERSSDRNDVLNSMSEYIKEIINQSMKKQKKRRGGKDNLKLDQIGNPSQFRHIHRICELSPNDLPSQTHIIKSDDAMDIAMPRNGKQTSMDMSKSTPNLAVIGKSPPQFRSRTPSKFTRTGAMRMKSSRRREPNSCLTRCMEPFEVTERGIDVVFSTTIDDGYATLARSMHIRAVLYNMRKMSESSQKDLSKSTPDLAVVGGSLPHKNFISRHQFADQSSTTSSDPIQPTGNVSVNQLPPYLGTSSRTVPCCPPTIQNSAYVRQERQRASAEDCHQAVQNNIDVDNSRNRVIPSVTSPSTVTSPSYFLAKPQSDGVENKAYLPVAKPEVPPRTSTPDSVPKRIQYGRVTTGEHDLSLSGPVPVKPPQVTDTPTVLAPGIPLNREGSYLPVRPAKLGSKPGSRERSWSPPRERSPLPPGVRSTPPPVPPRGLGTMPSPPAVPPRTSPRLRSTSPSQG